MEPERGLLADYFNGWYADMTGSPVKDEIEQRHLGLPPHLLPPAPGPGWWGSTSPPRLCVRPASMRGSWAPRRSSALDPGDDPALSSFHDEGVRSLEHFGLARRVLATATAP